MNINALGARLVMAVLRKEIDPRRAVATLKAHGTKCRPGAHGMCVTHGQSLTECEKERVK